jgi:hypothetical protein
MPENFRHFYCISGLPDIFKFKSKIIVLFQIYKNLSPDSTAKIIYQAAVNQ